MRIIFMGTAELACASLEALEEQPDFEVVAAVTQPDRPKGRHLKLQASPVKELALALRLPVLQPERARNETFIEQLRDLRPDLIVVVAYGHILPQSILDIPRLGCLNVHASLLPKFRGAAPIQWAILNDEKETGVTIMKMDAGMDSGDILSQCRTPIHPADNSRSLHDRLAKLGAALLVQTVPDYANGKITPRPQPPEGATIARKITREDGLLDWRQPARTLWNRIRALVPWPGAFTHLPAPSHQHLLKIWEAEPIDRPGEPGTILQADKAGLVVASGRGSLRILEVQLEGGRRLTAPEFLAGHHLTPGSRLGDSTPAQ
jgi:methionyl-tRNA formyltransferase